MNEGRPAWGKTDVEGRPSHHLAHHCMDVAAVLERLLDHPVLGARLAVAAGRPLRDEERGWLAAFAFLHDIGKLSPAFQVKAWPDDGGLYSSSHLKEGWCWIQGVMRRPSAMGGRVHTMLEPFACAPGADERWLLALFAHHGRPTAPGPRSKFPTARGYDWEREEMAIGEALGSWFPDVSISPELLERDALVHLFAGLLALADWIGSDVRSFAHEIELDAVGYGARARARAAEAVRRIGLVDAPWPSVAPDFATLTGFAAPRDAQALVADLPADVPLAILEAETGSGKTEAALWHFARARSAGHVDALYFAVPTRAAASQLHRRVQETMVRIGGPAAVLAVPGQLRAGEAEGMRLPGFEVRWDDGGEHWAAEHATRFLAAPVAVGTVDQALMAGLRTKHAHLRGAALSRSLLVIDEVHASDAYMNRIARALVRDHLALGGQALLMSATLGAGERAHWLEQPVPTFDEAVREPYPALWRHGSAAPLRAASSADEPRQKPVVPEPVATMAPARAADMALDAARRGARVLIVRNTVAAAIETWRAIVAAEPSLCLSVEGHAALHHSRFAAEDRLRLDRAVETAFGRDSPTRGIIAVGTQTLEQSLDIDADLLITDLCPMDVLLQRIGRLHRHVRARPNGFERPVVHVLCPEGGLGRLADGPAFENGLGGWREAGVLNGIYTDLRVLEATRRLVDEESTWFIPRDNRRLVEAATHPDERRRVQVETGWHEYSMLVDARVIADGQHGASLILDRSLPFPSPEQYPSSDESVQTRLGAQGPLLELPDGIIGPFGLPITRVAPPARWCAGLSGEEPVSVESLQEADAGAQRLRIEVGGRRFVYAASGLEIERDKGEN